MIGLDTNVLLDLMVSSSDHHKETEGKFKSLENIFCTTPTNIGECLRLLTHPKVYSSNLKINDACSLLDAFLDYYSVSILEETPEWWKDLPDLALTIPDLQGNEIFDARIALCLKNHNVRKIFTRDSDFLKYRFLQVIY